MEVSMSVSKLHTSQQTAEERALEREIFARQAEHRDKREATRNAELAVSSWQGKDDAINISQAAKEIFSRQQNREAPDATDPKEGEMRAFTRLGSEVVLESRETGRHQFTMGHFSQRLEARKAFNFDLPGGEEDGAPELMHTLTVTSAKGEVQRYEITANTLLTEDDAGNIRVREQTDGPLKGTDGQDILINITDNGTVDGGGGDDIIFNVGLNASLSGGDGNDVIVSMGSGAAISGGDGDDAIAVLRDTLRTFQEDRRLDEKGQAYIVGRPKGYETVQIDAGDGHDHIVTTDLYESRISGGNGADTIETGNLINSTLDGGDGSDEIRTRALTGSTILGGKGDDLIHIMGAVKDSGVFGGSGNDDIRVTGNTENSTFSGGAGDDQITVIGNTSSTVIAGGKGDDVIYVTGRMEASEVSGDSGDDLIWAKGATSDTQFYGGDGNDRLYVDSLGSSGRKGSTPGLIDGGSGDDLIVVNNASGSTILGGHGNDTIRVGSATRGSRGEAMIIDGGNGNDTISVDKSEGATILGGSGNDSIRVKDAGVARSLDNGVVKLHPTVIDGGEGDDHIVVDKSEGATVLGGSGNDSIHVAKADDYRLIDPQTGATTVLPTVIDGGPGVNTVTVGQAAAEDAPSVTTAGDLSEFLKARDITEVEDRIDPAVRASVPQSSRLQAASGYPADDDAQPREPGTFARLV